MKRHHDSVRLLLVSIHHAPRHAAAPGSNPQFLPQMPAANGNPGPRPRLVQGEILRDNDGRLYEKVGRSIRPLQRLFSGPRGEVLELPALAQADQRVTEPPPQSPDAEDSKPEAQAKTRPEAPAEPRQSPMRPSRRPPQHPRKAFGAPPSGGRSFISEPLPPEGATPNSRRQPLPPNGGAPNSRGITNSRQSPRRYDGQCRPQPSTTHVTAGGAAATGLKTAIPEQWIKPWEFQISREEALYDMRIASSPHSALLAFIRGLTNWFGYRQSWRKWQTLLSGKSLDEQLWAVRPPRGMIDRTAVRNWARQTLERAGYDARVMLGEWEILWRRKGL